MKGKKHNLTVSKLFREKLGSAEVIPSTAVRDELMRKLARREFMRFNPSRFNIYYLGSLAAAAATAMLLLSKPGSFRDKDIPQSLPVIQENTDTLRKTESSALAVNSKSEIREGATTAKGTGKVDNIQTGGIALKNSDSLITRIKVEQRISDIPGTVTQRSIVIQSDTLRNRLKAPKQAQALFYPSSSSGCPPLRVKFHNRSSEYDSCQWIFGDGGFSVEKEPVWIFDMEGNYEVQLRVFCDGAVRSVYSQVVKVLPRPVARFEVIPAEAVIPDDEIRFVNLSSDAARYKWDFGDGNTSDSFEPSYRYRKYDKYSVSLVVWSENGCSDSMNIENAFTGTAYFIQFPNAFIPNPGGPAGGFYSSKSDESAQIFHPEFYGVSEYQLRIFSKRGLLIFESNDINIGWDGYFKGQLSEPGVYIWKVRGKYINGEPFVRTGDVTLLRK